MLQIFSPFFSLSPYSICAFGYLEVRNANLSMRSDHSELCETLFSVRSDQPELPDTFRSLRRYRTTSGSTLKLLGRYHRVSADTFPGLLCVCQILSDDFMPVGRAETIIVGRVVDGSFQEVEME